MKFLFKILGVFLGLFANQFVFGQSNANWLIHNRIFHVDYSDNISYTRQISNFIGENNGNIISDYNGNTLFYINDDDDSIKQTDGNIIKNGNLIFTNTNNLYDTLLVSSYTSSQFIKINRDKYFFVTNSYNNILKQKAMMYTSIEKDVNNEWEVTSKNNVLKIGNTGFLNINRNPDNSYGLITRFIDYLYYYKIENGIFNLKDSLYFHSDAGCPDSLLNNPDYTTFGNLSNSGILNSYGNTGYFYDYAYIKDKNNITTDFINFFFRLYRFDIDKTNNKILSITCIDSAEIKCDNKFHYYIDDCQLALMPNDSILILPILLNTQFCQYANWSLRNQAILVYDLFNNTKDTIKIDMFRISSKVMPSGNLLLYTVSPPNTSVDSFHFVYTPITNKQIKNHNFQIDSFNFPKHSFTFGGDYTKYHLFDYLRFEPEITYSCSAIAKLKNLTNLSNGINDFRFYVCKDSSCNQVDSFRTFEPIVTFTKNGKYPYKVYGYSPSQTGYGEWYEDTIVVNIPERPTADFSVSDSLVCRYKNVEFTNKSIASDTNILGTISSHWYFANEKDSQIFGDNQNIKYAFTQTGNREVKLVYGSGFCTDTFTKNIEVLDAPMPVFSVNNLVGCTPFDLVINDTITRFVSQKEYYNSYKNSWDTIPLNQFNISYHFPNAGNYIIIQKLIGTNNCVTIRDTAKITIRPGITNQDSTKI